MAQPFLAYVLPIGTGGAPDQGLPGQPPGIWPSPGFPTHPIAPGGGPSQGPGFPTHPIAPGGGGGVGIWPGRPDQGLPLPPPGVNIPVFPGQLPLPGGGGGGGGGSGGRPAHPIAPGGGGFILVWHPQYGWILVHPEDGLKPDQGLPGAQPGPDQGLPGAQPGPDQGLPGRPPQPPRPDQGLPSTPPSAQPKR